MNQTDYISLIYKQLSNEISDEELNQLNEWLRESDENKEEAEYIALVWNETEIEPHQLENLAQEVDVDDEFTLLLDRIKADEELNKKPQIIPLRRRNYWGIAAGFALIIGLATTFILLNNAGLNANWAEIKTGDFEQEILLADGSSIHLNANSSLRYPEKFTEANREVELTGEAFFDISKDSTHPFIVHTPYEDVTVLGTSFNVRAYDNEPNTEVAVVTGKVEVNSGVTKTVLLPYEKVVVDHSSHVMGIEKTESLNESAWHTKIIKFDNTPVPVVLTDLEVFYQISITYSNPDLASCSFTSTFKDDSLDTVFVTLKTVLGVTITEKSKGNYVIDGGGCK